MPVTAKLSREFYERFGDEIANEFVNWFNAVDATYQAQLKDVNELNWSRVEGRFKAFDARMDALEAKLQERMNALETKLNSRIDILDSRMSGFESRIDARISQQRAQLIGWMFAFWTATVIPIIGVMLALSGAFRG